MLLFAGAVAWHLVILRLAPRLRLVKPNFAGRPILSSYGIPLFGYVVAAILALSSFGHALPRNAALYLGVMGAMWLLGAIDDVLGSREVGGFRGHFRKLFTEHKLTTGAMKALGGGMVGLVGGYYAAGGDIPRWIASALLIPLSANVLNLVDLRPGRATAVFFTGLGVTYMWANGRLSEPWIVAAIALVTLAFAVPDSLGRAMMGDSGSNALGAALGVTMALSTGPAFQTGAIFAFVAVHWYSEKHSITKLIESNPILRTIDRKLGVR
jgi:UDP-GlcNAc:undecaprenyl-phosphate GlcNAc-1-phosphate transferase